MEKEDIVVQNKTETELSVRAYFKGLWAEGDIRPGETIRFGKTCISITISESNKEV